MQTFTFTVDQIKEIYKAGIKRGNDEATAFEWGCRASGKEFDECIEAIHIIVNAGKAFTDDDYTTYDVVEEWFK